MPHRNILLPDSRWVTVFSVFSARACSRKILRVAAIHEYLSWVESLKSPSVRREQRRCMFDAKASQQDVGID